MPRQWDLPNTAFALILVAISALPVRGEKTPSYLKLDTCPPPIRLAVQGMKLPEQQIHDCSLHEVTVQETPASLLSIAYGPATQCATDCVYATYLGVVIPGNPIQMTELPGPDAEHLSEELRKRLLPDPTGKHDLDCYNGKNLFDFEIVKYRLTLAWHAVLRKPFECTWEARATMKSTATGGFYIFRDKGQVTIEPDHLNTQTAPQL